MRYRTTSEDEDMTGAANTLAAGTWTISGMTCEHCSLSVAEEVGEVPGVTRVEVDLELGRLTVQGEDVDEAAVRAAVAEAGYQVVS